MVSNSDEEKLREKSDAEIEAIIDTVHKTADASYRLAAIEEKHKRLKQQSLRNDKIQTDIRLMTLVILGLTLFSIIIGIYAIAK